jgi:uncharacterized membrane protein YeaQ/YmgE (transglycosylase-associated protein family)
MIGSFIGWIVFGFIAGGIARWLHPGPENLGCVYTIVLGVAGSLTGGLIAWGLHLGARPFEPAGYILSIIGAIILLAMGFLSNRARRQP